MQELHKVYHKIYHKMTEYVGMTEYQYVWYNT